MNKLHIFLTVSVLLLVTYSGCGTAEYKQRLSERVQQIGGETPFSQMHAAVAIPGTPLTIRLPQSVNAQPLVEGRPAESPTDPQRVRPPINIADLKLTYEGFVDDDAGGRTAYYCYLAATDMSSGARDPVNALRQRLMTFLPETTIQWKDVYCHTPDGLAIKWHKIEAAGRQNFYYLDKDGNDEFQPMEGIAEVYSRREGNFMVVVVWRVPTRIKDHVNLKDWAPRVAGSLSTLSNQPSAQD